MISATLINYMGSDLSVVNAARVSFGKVSDWNEPSMGKASGLSDRDAKLVRYLAVHKHFSPFGHAFCTWHVKAPVFVARQLVKHKFLRWNEISRRYVDDNIEFYEPKEWRGRSADKKQGSEGVVNVELALLAAHATALEQYEELLEAGVAPEQARMVLPQSMMTEWYWSGSLDAFADMCRLRITPDTQYETRQVALMIDKKMLELFPVSWLALEGAG
jgi:thymidylate synthase (FAD)